jgi:hypothetical protein
MTAVKTDERIQRVSLFTKALRRPELGALIGALVIFTVFAIVDTTGNNKPILHQVVMKIIFFIRERSTSSWMRDNKKDCAHLPYVITTIFRSFDTFPGPAKLLPASLENLPVRV